MEKLITVSGRVLPLFNKSHPLLSYTITETDIKALRTTVGNKEVLVSQIQLTCQCSGDFVKGTSTFVGTGSAVIVANTSRVECEGQSILLEGDKVTVTCDGTITQTSTGATSLGKASVEVEIKNANQTNVCIYQ
jgi:hypothetical protein